MIGFRDLARGPVDGDTEASFDIRAISVYATNWSLDTDPAPADRLPLAHLEEFYDIYQDQLPKVFLKQEHGAESIRFVATTW